MDEVRESAALDGLVTAMHDTLCRCGGKCLGWENDKIALLDFAERRWGSRYTFESWFAELGDA